MFLHNFVGDLCKSFVSSYHPFLGNCDNMLLRSVIESDCYLVNLNDEVTISQILPFLIDTFVDFTQSEMIFWGS